MTGPLASRADISRAIDRLAGAFGQPYASSATDAQRMITAWCDVLDDLPQLDLARAVTDIMRTAKKWPAPSALRDLCLGYATTRTTTARHRDDRGEGPRVFCLRCHTRDLATLPNGRFMPLHATNCPGLHDTDRLELQHALATEQPVWLGGSTPTGQRRTTEDDDA